MSRGNGWPHARAMGDGSASVDLLPEKEVDEDLADDLLDGAVTDAGIEPVVVAGEGVHALGGFVGQLVDLGLDVFSCLFGGHDLILIDCLDGRYPLVSSCAFVRAKHQACRVQSSAFLCFAF